MALQPTNTESRPSPLASGSSAAVADERRASARYPCMIETACRPITKSAGASWPARTVDVSAGGVALVLARRFEPGAILGVRLESPDGKVTRDLLLRVVHVAADVGGTWRLGCRLAGELDEEELRALRAQRVRPSEPDCRAWMRFDCDVETSKIMLKFLVPKYK